MRDASLFVCSDPECSCTSSVEEALAGCPRCGKPLVPVSDGITLFDLAEESTTGPGPVPASNFDSPCRGFRELPPRYQLEQELGSGGMGQVLLVRDVQLRRSVALKVLRRGSVSALDASRFLAEAQATAQLSHPNIIPLHDFGVLPGGDPYVTMKAVRGVTLRESMAAYQQAPSARELPRLLRILIDVTNAIGYAHHRGVVHRDLKPENVMIGEFGETIVLDWGLAAFARGGDARNDRQGPVEVGRDVPTLAETIVGTPAYMSPEQVSGDSGKIDGTTDLWALGVILYEILAGRRPFEASSLPVLQAAIVTRDPDDPGRSGREVPRELAGVALQCLAKDRDRRYRSAIDLRQDLEAYLDGRLLSAARYSRATRLWKWARRHPAVTASFLAGSIGLGSAGFLSLWQDRMERRREVERQVAEADSRIESIPDGDDPADPGVLEAHLAAVRALDRAIDLSPGDPALRARRKQLGAALGRVALAAGDHTLARMAFEGLESFGASPGEVEDLLAAVASSRRAGLDRQLARVRDILADVRSGLGRRGRDPSLPLLDDYVLEAAGFREEEVVALLSNELDRLSAESAAPGDRGPSLPERDLAAFLSRVLGALGSQFPRAVEPLARWSRVVRQVDLAVEVARALASTRRPEAREPLWDLSDAIGAFSTTWRDRVARWVVRVGGGAEFEAPATSKGFLRRGTWRRDAGDVEGAIEDFTKAIELDPGNSAALALRGASRYVRGELEAAAADLRRATEVDPENPFSYHVAGQVRCQTGDYQGAVVDLSRAIEKGGTAAEIYALRGTARAGLGDAGGALADLDRAVAIDPLSAEIFEARGGVYQEQGRSDLALRDYSRALELDPSYDRAYIGRAKSLSDLSRLEEAVADYTRAIELGTEYELAHYHRAMARKKLGDGPGAIADLSRSIELVPGSWRIRLERGILLFEDAQLDRAVGDFRRAVEIKPSNWAVWYWLGRSLVRHGERAEGLEALERSLGLAPADARAIVERAIEEAGGG